jgi:hypothetical protein
MSSIACKKNEVPLTIPKDKLTEILIDIHFSEAVLQNTNQHEKDSISAILYKQIYDIYGVSEEMVKKNVNELRQHPAEMKNFYQDLVKTIRIRSDSLPKH